MKDVDWAGLEIVPRLPYWPQANGEAVPDELIGAKIVAFGRFPLTAGEVPDELVIDYDTADGRQRRLILGYSEQGVLVRRIDDRRTSAIPGAAPE